MDENLPARLNFLTDASHLLLADAPETSAYIMRQRTSLMLDNHLQYTDEQRLRVCTRCGSILIPGLRAELELKARRRPKWKPKTKTARPTTETGGRPGMTKVLTCPDCSSKTEATMPAPPRSAAQTKKPVAASTSAAAAASAATGKQSASASSKKRAKSRKAGLQALLQSGPPAAYTTPSAGLNLSDFMKLP